MQNYDEILLSWDNSPCLHPKMTTEIILIDFYQTQWKHPPERRVRYFLLTLCPFEPHTELQRDLTLLGQFFLATEKILINSCQARRKAPP